MKNGILILLTIISFTLSGQGIYLDKLQVPPTLSLSENTLTFHGNKREFYSKKLKIKVDKNKKEIFLSTSSARPSKIPTLSDYTLTLSFNLEKYKVTDPSSYRFYWLDPDKKATELKPRSKYKTFHSEPIFPFREGDEWFYVDSNFNKLDDKSYDFVYPFYFNYAVVKIKDKYALINKALQLITQPIFDTITFQNYDTLNSPRFSVTKDGETFLIDTNGQVLYQVRYLTTCDYSSGIRNFNTYKLGGRLGLVIDDVSGQYHKQTVTPAIYWSLSAINERIAVVSISDSYGIIDPKGNVLLPIIYDEIRLGYFKQRYYELENEIIVGINSRYGFVNSSWNTITDLKFLDAQPFNLGFALVKTTDGKLGYIDKKGKEYWR